MWEEEITRQGRFMSKFSGACYAVSQRHFITVWEYPRTSERNIIANIERSKLFEDRHISSYDAAEELGIDHKTVLAHLKKTGYTKMLDIWVPHELIERNLMNRPFLKKLITGDEKWITYDKNVRKRSWSKAGQASQTVAKPGLTRNKVMLCVWWDWKGIIHYELLPPGSTI
ncbi:hypothetical protein ABMA28_000453 [Loxostege sticticalis]|uniref:Histone-lysine N-methyltransferase SETMAR n=1 Tax=Loxostege sticticalis TaxID=481309 RepID=A0ABD0TSQ5_LOXSC